jgi:hypothetical protein
MRGPVRAALWTLTLAVGALTAGVGVAGGFGLGGDAPARIPVPAREFSATVEDAAGVEITVRRVTFNGEVFFYGQLGEAQVTVPFENVAEARIEPSDEAGRVVLFAVLRDGGTARIVVEDDMPCYGEAPFGNYRLDIGRLRRLAFAP